MSWAIVCKVFKKRTFDLLSHKSGLILILFFLTLLITVIFLFSEVLVLWFSEKYTCVFNVYKDNIMSCSYEKRLCPKLPIDVVYTWVNGSDPVLLHQLNSLKNNLFDINDLRLAEGGDLLKCDLANCIPANAVVIKPPVEIIDNTFLDIPLSSRSFQMQNFNRENITVLFFHTNQNMQDVLKMESHLEGNRTIKRVYYTSESQTPLTYLLEDLILVVGVANTYSEVESICNKYGKEYFSDLITDPDKGITSFFVSNSTVKLSVISEKSHKVFGRRLMILQGYMVWDLNPTSAITDELSQNRFRDNDELLYSLRSLEKYAPWIRHVYVVTNGQIPSWLDLENPRLFLITHHTIFPNHSHLPTFSSPAIETHLHRIPGLSDRFIYLNDDILFGQPVWPDDFQTLDGEYKVYLSYPVPDCRDGCPGTWIRDGYCDRSCNNSECEWDGGDCDPISMEARNNESARIYFGGNVGNYPWADRSKNKFCDPGCANNWIADRYCDSVCNVLSCGFDGGDCGMSDFDKIQRFDLTKNKLLYNLSGYSVAYFNYSSLSRAGISINEGLYDHHDVVRSFSIAQSFNVITIILMNNQSRITLNASLMVSRTSGEKIQINFSFIVDTTFQKPVIVKDEKVSFKIKNDTHADQDSHKFNRMSDFDQLKPEPERKISNKNQNMIKINLTNYLLPIALQKDLAKLIDEYKFNLITKKGFQILQYNIVESYLLANDESTTVDEFITKLKPVNKDFKLNISNISKNNSNKLHPLNDAKTLNSTNQYNPFNFRARKPLSVDTYASKPTQFNHKAYGFLPWEKQNIFEKLQTLYSYTIKSNKDRKLFNAYTDSIRHVNRLYNKVYGYFARKLPIHGAHFLDKSIITDMQEKFPEEWIETSSHNIRSSNDMQLSFSYFYFLMSEIKQIDFEEFFSEMDIDKSGVLSDRELRILATKLYLLPLSLRNLEDLENMFIGCYRNSNSSANDRTTHQLKFEKYYNPKLPQITVHLFQNCSHFTDMVGNKFSNKSRYNYMIVPNADDYFTFKMFGSNASITLKQLDEVRQNPKRFICLNDDSNERDEQQSKSSHLLRIDFYASLFPQPSNFELKMGYRNKFLYYTDYERHKLNQKITKFFLIILTLFTCSNIVLYAYCCRKSRLKPSTTKFY